MFNLKIIVIFCVCFTVFCGRCCNMFFTEKFNHAVCIFAKK
jgi:hypothetical protein